MKEPRTTSRLEDLAERFTYWVGSMSSIAVHTAVFAACFALGFLGFAFDKILLVLTTAVSLEAIYLAIFIQMTVNRNTESLEEVEEDIDEIQEDIAEVEKDIDDIQEDIAEVEKDIDEIQEDVDEIQEDVEEINEDDAENDMMDQKIEAAMVRVEGSIHKLLEDIERLKGSKKQ
jgi:septal ring factor EnvC (AmiA/AmiB activator)